MFRVQWVRCQHDCVNTNKLPDALGQFERVFFLKDYDYAVLGKIIKKTPVTIFSVVVLIILCGFGCRNTGCKPNGRNRIKRGVS